MGRPRLPCEACGGPREPDDRDRWITPSPMVRTALRLCRNCYGLPAADLAAIVGASTRDLTDAPPNGTANGNGHATRRGRRPTIALTGPERKKLHLQALERAAGPTRAYAADEPCLKCYACGQPGKPETQTLGLYRCTNPWCGIIRFM